MIGAMSGVVKLRGWADSPMIAYGVAVGRQQALGGTLERSRKP
jgi:hypothetical protein